MSFFTLPRELRNLVYHALLCPPDGVRIHSDNERVMKKMQAGWANPDGFELKEDDYDDEEKAKYKEDHLGLGPLENHLQEGYAVTPVPTAIFHVNHQVKQEATEVFYGYNRFTFNMAPRFVINFLKSLPSNSRRLIKEIGFTCLPSTGADSLMGHWVPFAISLLATSHSTL